MKTILLISTLCLMVSCGKRSTVRYLPSPVVPTTPIVVEQEVEKKILILKYKDTTRNGIKIEDIPELKELVIVSTEDKLEGDIKDVVFKVGGSNFVKVNCDISFTIVLDTGDIKYGQSNSDDAFCKLISGKTMRINYSGNSLTITLQEVSITFSEVQ